MKIKTTALFCFAALFVPNLVKAQQLGCYVDFRFLNTCFEGDVSCALRNDLSEERFFHGTAVGNLCYKYSITLTNLSSCDSAYSDSQANLASCNGGYNSLVATHNTLVANYNSQLKLIKKLRKACGTKCKKIK